MDEGRHGHRREAAAEDPATAENMLLFCVKQVVAPGHCRSQRLVARRQVARTAEYKRLVRFQSRQDCVDRQHADLSRGQLDSQRETVESPANLGYDRRVLDCNGEVSLAPPAAIEE